MGHKAKKYNKRAGKKSGRIDIDEWPKRMAQKSRWLPLLGRGSKAAMVSLANATSAALRLFMTPYRSCERGPNAHTNGLVRQYLPKQTKCTGVSDGEEKAIDNRLNNQPRKVRQYKTPFEVC
jgi:hypothetical protein